MKAKTIAKAVVSSILGYIVVQTYRNIRAFDKLYFDIAVRTEPTIQDNGFSFSCNFLIRNISTKDLKFNISEVHAFNGAELVSIGAEIDDAIQILPQQVGYAKNVEFNVTTSKAVTRKEAQEIIDGLTYKMKINYFLIPFSVNPFQPNKHNAAIADVERMAKYVELQNQTLLLTNT